MMVKVRMSAEIWRDLRNLVFWTRDLFGAPEGWSAEISWSPDRCGERKMEPKRVVGYVYAKHETHRAHVDVRITADGEKTFTVMQNGRVFPNVQATLAPTIVHLQSGGRLFAE